MALYLTIAVLQEPFDIQPDEADRARLSFNILALKTASDTFVQEIINLLQTAGVGVFGTNIFASSRANLPTGNGPFLSIIPTTGMSPMNTQNDINPPAYQRPGAQIVVRARSYVAAESMARAAYTALVGIRNQTVNPV